MSVTLVGTVVNSCDAITGFNQGNISTDDDFVQGTGAIGLKAPVGANEMYTTTISGGPYNFSSGGGQFGYHIIMWFNTKTPIQATSGLRIVVGNGTSRGHWNVEPSSFYKGGFITRVTSTSANFSSIAAGTWTVGGNPAQLSSVTQVGGVFETTTSIMGNFNNIQLDQMTIGLGVRADGTGNSFETVRSQDEDTSFWGWWSSKAGAYIGQGKLYIGPATGSATCTFDDEGAVVIFPDVSAGSVAVGFYEINVRGGSTAITWVGNFIAAENPSAARWSLTMDSTASLTDTNSVYAGFDTLTLNSLSLLNGVKLDGGTSIVQNDATMEGCQILNANTSGGVAQILSNNPANISNCDFTAPSTGGHAIEIDSTGTYSFAGNTFTGYDSTIDSTNAAIYNNSGGLVTLNVSGASSPSYRNGTDATTVINNTVQVTLTGMQDNSEVRIYEAGTTTPVAGIEDATSGSPGARTFAFNDSPGDFVDIIVHSLGYKWLRVADFEIPGSNSSLPIQQVIDRNYSNP